MTKTVVITGASGDIGMALAKRLAREPYNLVLQYFRGGEKAASLASELEKTGASFALCRADLREPSGAAALLRAKREAFGEGLYGLVNVAGGSYFGLCQDISDEAWREVMALNLDSVFYCCRAFIGELLADHHGSIVNVSSMWGVSGAAMEAAYSAAKAGVIGLTKALAAELGPSGIRVNAVAPGVIEGRMNEALGEEVLRELADNASLGRLGKASEIAEVIAFLLSEGASYVTGQVLLADGGFLA